MTGRAALLHVVRQYSVLQSSTDTLEHGTEHVALEISFPGRDAPLNSVSLPVVFITRMVK